MEQELFSISKLSLEDSGPDYIVTCSWNGDTFIVDQKSQIAATFQLGETVSAFCSGMYTVKSNTKPVSCFVFITMSRKVNLFFYSSII